MPAPDPQTDKPTEQALAGAALGLVGSVDVTDTRRLVAAGRGDGDGAEALVADADGVDFGHEMTSWSDRTVTPVSSTDQG